MSDLANLTCVPCRKGSSRLSPEEIARSMTDLPLWQVLEYDGAPRLVRVFKFKDFSSPLAFANQIGAIAAAEDHHPVLLVEWGRLSVSWYTHAIGGLHQNDMIMAAKTDQLYQTFLSAQP
jgi:4a-hydroxytetrahydrobiopterin dehydratase